jgi:hypothetical protein
MSDSPSTPEQALLFEAILRYSEIPLEPGSACFISIERRNPSRELLDLLEACFSEERIRFRKESEAVEIPVEDGILTHKLVDSASGKESAYYCFVEVERPSPERAVVEVEMLGCGNQYTLQREEGRWVVVRERTIWIA